jgi:hypothetical protein
MEDLSFPMLDSIIDSKHQGALVHAIGFETPNSIETLQTHISKNNCMIHPEWLQRYVSHVCICYLITSNGSNV